MSKAYRLNWREMQEFRQDQLNTILSLTERLGRVAHITMLEMDLYLISEPDIIRELLLKHPQQLHRDPYTKRVLGRIVGQGLFIAEDRAWERQRKLLQPVFHAAHIHDFGQIFADYAREMCAGWTPGNTIRLDQEMMALALRIICKTMFSTDVDHLTGRIGELMQAAMVEAEAQLRLGLPVPAWLPTPSNLRQKRALRAIRELLLAIIHERQAKVARGEEPEADLLTMLLLAEDDAGKRLSDLEVLDECMTIFVAGHETTAVALTWTWTLLLQHPNVLKRLTQEVATTLDDKAITYAALAELPYLAQVVKESLRYYPPAPGFARTPTEAFEIDGHSFKPGNILMISSYTLHRQDEFYPEPAQFSPERFASNAEEPPRYAYLPFGAGSRTCIGNAFAMLEMQVVLATMIQSIRLALAPQQEIVPETLVTLRPRDGVRVRVEKRDQSSPVYYSMYRNG